MGGQPTGPQPPRPQPPVFSAKPSMVFPDLQSGEVLVSNGRMNPQIRFGEDLMSRVSYAIMHPDGIAEITEVVRAALNELIQEAATEANIDPDLIL